MFPVIFQEKSVQPKAPMIWMMYGHMRLPGLGAFCASSKCVLQPRHYYHYYQPTDAIKHRPKPLQKHNGELANTTKAKKTGELLQKTPGNRCKKKTPVQIGKTPTCQSRLPSIHMAPPNAANGSNLGIMRPAVPGEIHPHLTS